MLYFDIMQVFSIKTQYFIFIASLLWDKNNDYICNRG